MVVDLKVLLSVCAYVMAKLESKRHFDSFKIILSCIRLNFLKKLLVEQKNRCFTCKEVEDP